MAHHPLIGGGLIVAAVAVAVAFHFLMPKRHKTA
jgi:hypothetical protein